MVFWGGPWSMDQVHDERQMNHHDSINHRKVIWILSNTIRTECFRRPSSCLNWKLFITTKHTDKVSRASHRFIELLIIIFPLRTGIALAVSPGGMCFTLWGWDNLLFLTAKEGKLVLHCCFGCPEIEMAIIPIKAANRDRMHPFYTLVLWLIIHLPWTETWHK